MDTPRSIIWQQANNRVIINTDDGFLTIYLLDEGAARVRFTRTSEDPSPSLILENCVFNPSFKVKEEDQKLSINLKKLKVVFDQTTNALTFYDGQENLLLAEKPNSRQLSESTIQGEACLAAEQQFLSDPTEKIFGMGQFQDGYLDIKGLPRRLTQVNSQIAIPFYTSNKGYALLWHNYGLTDFNPADEQITFSKSATRISSPEKILVTTAEGTQEETRLEGLFTAEFETKETGKYAFLLDVGQKMARGYRVTVDRRAVIDYKNFWLPPTISWFDDLEGGMHDVTFTGQESDAPVIYYRKVEHTTTLRSPVADAVDYVVFAGKADEAIGSYRRLAGPMPMLPQWALGYIHCRERYKSQDEILDNTRQFRERNLPMDMIVQDWQYWGKYGWNAMQFDEQHYPDPEKMVQDIHSLNARLMVSVWSKIDPTSEVGQEFTRRDLFIKDTQWVDFYKPEAAALYWEQFSKRLLSTGIDAWWQDATEPENDDLEGRRIGEGQIPGETYRLIYPLLVTKTVYEGSRRDRPGQRVFILSRSAYPGAQRYAVATWSGDIGNDWEAMRKQLAAGLSYMASGMPWWTFDAGGFFRPGDGQYKDPDYHETFLRWLQLSVFMPLMRVHGYMTDTEFWHYGEAVTTHARNYLNLRYRLLPYIYSEAARVNNGYTLMRPLVMDFAADDIATGLTDQFMFGPSIMVAPVLRPAVAERSVYLPAHKGGWIDFWTGQRYEGETDVDATATLDHIPLFIKAGGIIPMGPVKQYAAQYPDAPVELHIYTGASGMFTLYEDDGETFAYEDRAHASIKITWNEEDQHLKIGKREGSFEGMPATKTFHIIWVTQGFGRDVEAEEVIYNGEEVIIIKS
ncbi:alpha-D-xyloside xylohydrolase [Mucilaginibacter yixingensis]|uniref:Alpha-D-xyloside xylohydrolase n=1 Tax=Mucilaginibacter yixingensis TaxID=1295612 RepID=A0A2T5J5T2_9SPHI|nr:TIM-barrel domain-containing protein [Mucilaginibacter yixingensis]PTQ93542.1 alpha-D-xyloside xylohydrolase [Mucilaginibacter yixingensis]